MSDTLSPPEEGTTPVEDGPRRRRWRPLQVVAVTWTLLFVLLLGAMAGLWIARGGLSSSPADRSVDVGFSRDMQQHHSQAVQMSLLLLERSGDPEVRTLATDVLLTQQQQAGQMYGWLVQWGLTQTSSAAPMAWMTSEAVPGMAGMGGTGGMDHSGATETASMPGMASAEDLQRLTLAAEEEADRVYLQLMIPHHEAGVAMATAAAERAETTPVRTLAQRILTSQNAELDVLRTLLQEHGGS